MISMLRLILISLLCIFSAQVLSFVPTLSQTYTYDVNSHFYFERNITSDPQKTNYGNKRNLYKSVGDLQLNSAVGKSQAEAFFTFVDGLFVTKNPLARGRAAEQCVLNDFDLTKNTQKIRTGEGASIPDALTKRQSIEIKDCIGIPCTRQIRIQTRAAREAGRESVLITGSKTRVSGPAERAFDRIIRRDDLGPQ